MFRRRTKYNNKRVVVDGIRFDSKAEAARYQALKLLEKAGEIRDLKRQVNYPLLVNGAKVCSYRGDFEYRTKAGVRIVEDVKGYKTPMYRLKKKLLAAVHGIQIAEVK